MRVRLSRGISTGIRRRWRIRGGISREKAEAFVGAGSIYQLTPCTEKAALARQPEEIEIVEKVDRKQIESNSAGPVQATRDQVDELIAHIDNAYPHSDPDSEFDHGVLAALKWCRGRAEKPELDMDQKEDKNDEYAYMDATEERQ